ncbi:MAG: acetyl/propionyl/methylcrotonyl-CoA carboxylase subunit alpha [Pseudomonadota bacterium]
MFRKILIANRGEIACRVMATARRLGVQTVAVFSDADANAKHTAMADEAVHIGPAAAAESYLNGARIIEAARQTGAEAIHPGYGFLSENPGFVEAVEDAGLVFIGPPASAIRAMGLKDAAKALMETAGVPVVPGYHGESQDPDLLAAEAENIGYPVLIKARAGGGGKGMRLVEGPSDFKAALAGAQREGQASFGDPACLVEKFIPKPRHIEIQVFGDKHGAAIHLFERDCSLQRRHQKVIEEAPAPDMPDEVRAAMGQAAVEAAKAIGYHGAGTVEFIVEGSGPLRADGFWFMEMNTRLQVEHPVTEAVTGLDLVELQLRVASGEPLGIAQDDLSINGWAFEARVYAEDASKGFLPATGTLDHLAFPQGAAFAQATTRIDSGVRPGDEISPWYDPMIAKVITHGPTRSAALNKLRGALGDCHVAGCVTNLEFLGALSRHDGFARGQVDTGLIARDIDALTDRPAPSEPVVAAAAVGALGLLQEQQGSDPWSLLLGWRHWTDAYQFVDLQLGETRLSRRITALDGGSSTVRKYRVDGGDGSLEIAIAHAGDDRYRLETDGKRLTLALVFAPNQVSVFTDGRSFTFDLPNALAGTEQGAGGGDTVVAPMPGLIKVVSAATGDNVDRGDALIVIEAMKMEHTLTAPRNGVVEEVLASVGDQVTDGALLLRLAPEDD